MTMMSDPAGAIVGSTRAHGVREDDDGRNGHATGAPGGTDAANAGERARLQRIAAAVRQILVAVGEDPGRDGLAETPERVARMYGELLEGYAQVLGAVINGALFEVEYDAGEMVTVASIPYTSLCEHHMLPFVGVAHVAYVPRGKVIGLSKLPRIIDVFARRLQVQERLTGEIADALVEALDPYGAIVVVEGQHSCASVRGVKKHGVNMITTAKRGVFGTSRDMVEDFYRQIGRPVP